MVCDVHGVPVAAVLLMAAGAAPAAWVVQAPPEQLCTKGSVDADFFSGTPAQNF